MSAAAVCGAAEVALLSEPATADCSVPDAPPLVIAPDESWTQLGAKPKAMVSSTPSHQEPWSQVDVHSRGGRHSSLALPHYNIEQDNRYNILDFHDATFRCNQ